MVLNTVRLMQRNFAFAPPPAGATGTGDGCEQNPRCFRRRPSGYSPRFRPSGGIPDTSGMRATAFLERIQNLFGLPLQRDLDKHSCRHVHLARVQQRDIVPDKPIGFQAAAPADDRRTGDRFTCSDSSAFDIRGRSAEGRPKSFYLSCRGSSRAQSIASSSHSIRRLSFRRKACFRAGNVSQKLHCQGLHII